MSYSWIWIVVIFSWLNKTSSSQSETNSNYSYLPFWTSLDKRPLPPWYDAAKLGVFLHWGVYSVPAFKDEWIWRRWKSKELDVKDFMDKHYPSITKYEDFTKEFKAQSFNATFWANAFYNAGAKYVVLTSKHHDGYALWPSSKNTWNSVVTGPRRDLVEELSKAVRSKGMHFGLYYSLYEWFNPLFLTDQGSDFINQDYVDTKMLPEMREIVVKYKPDIVWADGDWEASDIYFKSKEFLTWLYNESPVRDSVVVNDRWGKLTRCKHGGFMTCSDRFNPLKIQGRKWENCFSIDKRSWGYRHDADLADYMTGKDLIDELVSTVSCGGNFLMNIGPTKEGIIARVFLRRLQTIGKWIEVNGRAIYNTSPWSYQKDMENKHVWYTVSKKDKGYVYGIILKYPSDRVLKLRGLSIMNINHIKMLGYSGRLSWKRQSGIVSIDLPKLEKVMTQFAWTLEIKNTISQVEPENI